MQTYYWYKSTIFKFHFQQMREVALKITTPFKLTSIASHIHFNIYVIDYSIYKHDNILNMNLLIWEKLFVWENLSLIFQI